MITNKEKTKERVTSQKKIILDYLKSVKSHPSAEDIYLAVRKKLPRISRGTVYRILKNFKEKKEIQEISGKISRFNGETSQHNHFICQGCGKIFDIFEKCEIRIPRGGKTASEASVRNRAFLERGSGDYLEVGKVKNYKIYFYGNCKKCQKT